MPLIQLAGQGQWGSILKDELTKNERGEENHILKEGRDAEKKFKKR